MAGNNLPVKVKIDNVVKKYSGRNGEMVEIKGVSLDIHENEFVCVVGPSGCGKSTLLNIIAGLHEPTSGQVLVDGQAVSGPGPDRGVVFQQYALFPWLTVQKNVEFGLKLQGMSQDKAEQEAKKYIKMVDLEQFAQSYPKELSGGMKQRVAIARAMANDPAIILADEPTGALDSSTGRLVMDLFHRLHREQGKTIVLITHNPELAEETERIITISDGQIVGVKKGGGVHV